MTAITVANAMALEDAKRVEGLEGVDGRERGLLAGRGAYHVTERVSAQTATGLAIPGSGEECRAVEPRDGCGWSCD